jgi:hypothetical protein
LSEPPRRRRTTKGPKAARVRDEVVVDGVEWIEQRKTGAQPQRGRQRKEHPGALKQQAERHRDEDDPWLEHQRRIEAVGKLRSREPELVDEPVL